MARKTLENSKGRATLHDITREIANETGINPKTVKTVVWMVPVVICQMLRKRKTVDVFRLGIFHWRFRRGRELRFPDGSSRYDPDLLYCKFKPASTIRAIGRLVSFEWRELEPDRKTSESTERKEVVVK